MENIFLNTLRLIILFMARSFCTFCPQDEMVMECDIRPGSDAELFTSRKLACVASVSSRGSSRKLGQEQKNKKPFFCFRSNFRAITRLETLATQASRKFA